MVPEQEVDEKIAELGRKISEDYAGRQVHLVCVLKGGVFFMCELAKRITVPVTMDFMSVSSYGAGTESSETTHLHTHWLSDSQLDICAVVVDFLQDQSSRVAPYALAWLVAAVPDVRYLCVGGCALAAPCKLGAEDYLRGGNGLLHLSNRYRGGGNHR